MDSPSGLNLYPYQRDWLKDSARFKIGMQSRQTGKTFTATLELCLDALQNQRRWVILSRGERQAKEAMEEGVKKHLRALGAYWESQGHHLDYVDNALECRLPGGSRITALPANPDTARGFSAGVLLDEFAFHLDSHKIWQSLFPVISAGHPLRVISTPNGKNNKFYDLVTAEDSTWSRHRTDIYQAVEQGLPRNIEEMKAAMADPDSWRQEFELQWLDESTAWLTYDTIDACEGDYAIASGRCTIGWDVARRRDLSVIWVLTQHGDILETVEISAMRAQSFESQVREFERLWVTYNVRRAAIDAQGMGAPIAEQLKKKYGAAIEAVDFTNQSKSKMAFALREKFESRTIRIPFDREVRESLHSVKRIGSNNGVIKFDAERTAKGHGDYFWALALAVKASANSGPAKLSVTKTLGQKFAGY